MAITIHERFESRRGETGQDPWQERLYVIRGTDDDYSARVTLEAGSPMSVDVYNNASVVIWRQRANIEQVGPELWHGSCQYDSTPPIEQSEFEFDIGTVTQHMTHSLATIARHAPGGKTAPNHNNAVGVTSNGVEGTDVEVPTYAWAERHFLPATFITPAYKATVFALAGKTNHAAWRGFGIREVRFDGLKGRTRKAGDYELEYRFTASPSIEDFAVGEGANQITGVDKKGWEYLWIEWEEATDGGATNLVRIPKAVFVEKMLYDGDMSLLGIGT